MRCTPVRYTPMRYTPCGTCYGSVKNGFDSAILTKIPRMEKKEELGRRQTTKCGAKCQARTCPVTTLQQPGKERQDPTEAEKTRQRQTGPGRGREKPAEGSKARGRETRVV